MQELTDAIRSLSNVNFVGPAGVSVEPISYLDTLMKTGSENIEATIPRRWILFAGFVARMKNTRLPKCVTLEELVGGARTAREAKKKNGWGTSWTASELSVSTPTSG